MRLVHGSVRRKILAFLTPKTVFTSFHKEDAHIFITTKAYMKNMQNKIAFYFKAFLRLLGVSSGALTGRLLGKT